MTPKAPGNFDRLGPGFSWGIKKLAGKEKAEAALRKVLAVQRGKR